VSVGMSLVIDSGFGFDRIRSADAGSESRKSTESSSKKQSQEKAIYGPLLAMQNFGNDALRPEQRRESFSLRLFAGLNSASTSTGDTARMGKCSSS
jgi:hypothetical protein